MDSENKVDAEFMEAKVIDVSYKRSVPLTYLSQGHKGGSLPASTSRLKRCGGGNGSYVMYDRSGNADITVIVELSDGSAYPISIGREVRQSYEGRLSSKLAGRVKATCPARLRLVQGERGPEIDGRCLNEWLKSVDV